MISLAVAAAGWVGVSSPGDYAASQFPPVPRHDPDGFLTWLVSGDPRHPIIDDYLAWAMHFDPQSPDAALSRLALAFDVLMPSEVELVREAGHGLASMAPPIATKQSHKRTAWDPCAVSKRSRKRAISVHPSELPVPWIKALRRAASGLPGRDAMAPSPEIVRRMREKLCQYYWTCRQNGEIPNLQKSSITAFCFVLEGRLRSRPGGIRWATMRATVEELERFSRYSGVGDMACRRHLKALVVRYTRYERQQDALKFAALFETGHSVLTVLERAGELRAAALQEDRPSARHRLRTAAMILALAAVLGLRTGNANLVLGENVRWESNQWVIDTEITKTRATNGENLAVVLRPEFGAFIDAALLGDAHPSELSRIKIQLCATRRSLVVRSDGRLPHPGYVARIFKQQTGNTLTSTRTMLHTDQAVRRGESGTRDTMQVLHQRSRKIAEKYQGRAARQAAVQRVQDRVARHQAQAFNDDQQAALAALRSIHNGGDPHEIR